MKIYYSAKSVLMEKNWSSVKKVLFVLQLHFHLLSLFHVASKFVRCPFAAVMTVNPDDNLSNLWTEPRIRGGQFIREASNLKAWNCKNSVNPHV